MGRAHELDFRIYAPGLSFFEKASAGDGRTRRIGGVISTEDLDKQGEVIVQKGLDFTHFLREGWFNDNHSKKTADVLGYPDRDALFKFQKGDALPDGRIADRNGTWAEGWLYDTPQADRVWQLGRAMSKSGGHRRLGFSIEGKVKRRAGPNGHRVVKAEVRNVAITNCPVGNGTRMETLAKSLTAAYTMDDTSWDALCDDIVSKALSMGAATPGTNPSAQGPTSGEGAGNIITPQSLEQDGQKNLIDKDDDEEVSKAEALALIKSQFNCDDEFAERAYSTLINLEQAGLL